MLCMGHGRSGNLDDRLSNEYRSAKAQSGPPLEYNGPIYTPEDFWPLAIGNYWLWMDPEIETIRNWRSMEIIKSRSIKGIDAYLTENIPYVSESYTTTYFYIVDHPKGLFKTLGRAWTGGAEEDFLRWAADPDDVSTLVTMITGEFIPGTFPHPALYDANQESTVAPLADVAPFDQCPDNNQYVVDGGPDDFIVLPEHLVLHNHTVSFCDDGTRERRTHSCLALGIGPIVPRFWPASTLAYAIIDGHEISL